VTDNLPPLPRPAAHHGTRNIVVFVVIGAVAGCALAPVGTLTANLVDPRLGNILFICFLVIIGAQMGVKAVRAGRASR
jgi:uncharacterized membrane protein YfcA